MTLPPSTRGAQATTQDNAIFMDNDGGLADTLPHEAQHTVQSGSGPNSTRTAEQDAAASGNDEEPARDTQLCRGWIELHSHYANFDHIPISGRITLSKVEEGGGLTQISQDQVDYERIAGAQEVFISPRPAPRPAGLGAVLQEGADPEPDTDTDADPDTDTAEPPTNQAQPAATAAANGNARILLGGDEGVLPGLYRIAFQPTIAYGKLRVDPTAITASESAELANRFKIIPTDGVIPADLTEANTTDEYLQVPGTTTVHTEWSQDVTVMCMPRTMPTRVEMAWTDFKANPFQNNRSEGRLRTLHPKARHTFFCFVNKVEEVDREYVVLSGLRTPAEQDELYCQSRSGTPYCTALGLPARVAGRVTGAKKWESNHNYGLALDMQDFNAANWVQNGIPSQMAGTVGDAFGLAWGGRWTRPDFPHFELSTPAWRTLRAHVNNGVVAANRSLAYDGNVYVSF